MPSPPKPRPTGARKKGLDDRSQVMTEPLVNHGYFKGFDGTKLFYSIEGRGHPLVFCYGLVCSSLHWTYQIEYFRKNYQVIWFDYRGHQNSEAPQDIHSLTIENIAKDLKILLDELKIPHAVLLGHSMGVNVVLEFLRQNPERVQALVLANGTAKRPLETIFRTNILQPTFQVLRKAYQKSPSLLSYLWKMQKKNPITRTLISLGGFNPHLTPQADIESYIDQVSEMDPKILLQLIENYESYDASPWLHTIQIPTLVIAGEHDKIIPIEQQELLHQLIPGSVLELIRHGSHCPQMDLPELVNHKIENFLSKIDYSSSTTEVIVHSEEGKRQSIHCDTSTPI